METTEQMNRYIDDLCSDPSFLCSHREMCGKNTSIYSSVENVNNICDNITKSNECENDFQECVVQATNLFEGSSKYISTSFVNIIIPIPKVLDSNGNQKFIRLPALSSNKKPDSPEICSICSCMNRFATSPGAGENTYTPPGQNMCTYLDKFEYYYYPVYIENLNKKIKDAPIITLGKHSIINSNIIQIFTEEDLTPTKLYTILLKNGISKDLSVNFITNVLYKNNPSIVKELKLLILSKSV